MEEGGLIWFKRKGFIYLGKNEGERSTSNNEEQENHLCYLRPHSVEIKYNKFLLQQEGVEEDIELDGLRFNYWLIKSSRKYIERMWKVEEDQ